MRDSVSTHNNAGLVSKVSEEIASENAKNCRCQPHWCCLTPPPQEPPRISAITLYCQKGESLGYVFAADSMGLSSFKYS